MLANDESDVEPDSDNAASAKFEREMQRSVFLKQPLYKILSLLCCIIFGICATFVVFHTLI